MEPDVGQTASFSAIVDAGRTAASLETDTGMILPKVFGTPFMIADMERACAEVMRPYLPDGSISVGVHIDVRHKAPTGVGQMVTSTATFTEKEGALFWFSVVTADASGTVGEGRIARAVVDQETLMTTAEGRK